MEKIFLRKKNVEIFVSFMGAKWYDMALSFNFYVISLNNIHISYLVFKFKCIMCSLDYQNIDNKLGSIVTMLLCSCFTCALFSLDPQYFISFPKLWCGNK